MSQALKVIKQETSSREELEKTIQQKLVFLDEAQRKEDRSIEVKIEKKMKKVIDLAASKTFEATKQKDLAFSKVSNLEAQNKELQEEINQWKTKETDFNEIQKSFEALEREKDSLEIKLKSAEQENQKLSQEVKEMRLALRNLNELKDLLNRYTNKNQEE